MTYISDKQLKAHTALLELSRASMLPDGAPMILVDQKHQIDPATGNLKTFIECHHHFLKFSISKDAEVVSNIQLNDIPTNKLTIKFVLGTDGITRLTINQTTIKCPKDLENVLDQTYPEINKKL